MTAVWFGSLLMFRFIYHVYMIEKNILSGWVGRVAGDVNILFSC